jgi:4-hydroxy-L-threonine phosphate dehydrogenase PdxA
LEIDDDAKEIVRDIGTAINESVENSSKVAEAIERLRDAGYEMELTLRLEIGLRPHAGESGEEGDTTLDLTDEDVEVLQRMKIRIDPEEKD